MTADQTFKHFVPIAIGTAQCDIRVLATLIHLMHMLSDIYNVILSGVEGQNDNLSLVAERRILVSLFYKKSEYGSIDKIVSVL